MKIKHIPSLLAGLALSASLALHPASAASDAPKNVTVTFQDPDKFTDVQDRHTSLTSTADLNELRDCVQQTAAPRLAPGHTLLVTFLDIDLAGQIRPDKDNIRVMTATTFPRAHVKFQLLDAEDKVVKEGERKLIDLDYQNSIEVVGRSDPLFYDKKLLKDWLHKEFKAGS